MMETRTGPEARPRGFDLARAVSMTLRTGVTVSALLSFLGLILSFQSLYHGVQDSASFPPEAVLAALWRGDPAAIVLLGVAILILTPALRVFEMALSNLLQRDWVYAALSSAVLLLMGAGLFAIARF